MERLPAVRAARPHGPYMLGGHCAGGMVALEIARQLLRDGEEVHCVVMIDTVAPRAPKLVFPGISVGTAHSRRRAASPPPAADEAPTSAFARYRDAIKKYAPAPYPGRVVVLRPEQHPDPRPAMGWTAYALEARSVPVPGDHHSVLTRHLEATAAQVRACLQSS